MPTSLYMTTYHEPALVVASLVVAVLSSFVALDLARRVHAATISGQSRWWWAGGSLTLGTGIWAMHFVGMLGFDASIPLGYDLLPTLASWTAAVAAAAVALSIAARERLGLGALLAGSTSMAVGICAMHYLGMAALDLQPGIVWRAPLVVASVAIAWGASATALAIFFLLREQRGARRLQLQLLASLVMGGAIGGMHYTAMAAAQLPLGAVCRSTNGLSGQPLAAVVTTAALLLLGGSLLMSIVAALARSREVRLKASLQKANAALQRRDFEDPLTGLPNRALFNDRLQHATARIARHHSAAVGSERLAVLYLDLDAFKPINESFGHVVGDEVLCEVARRLQVTVGGSDTLARMGADEFVVMIEAPNAESAAIALAQRILHALHRPFTPRSPGGQAVVLSCSIGVAVFPDHDDAGHRLLACADAAMDAAKRAGGDTCVAYAAGMASDAAEQVLLQRALRTAIERGELMLYYQPKVDPQQGRVHGLEALLRWRHPERGLISPAVFVPLAERFGLIGAMGNWVIDEACAQLARWEAQGLRCRVAVNLSPHQLRRPDLATRIHDALDRHGLQPSALVCEITESAMMENLHAERAVLDQIAALGVWLSIDDFGTGYSSLAHLRNIPARQLKIDRSFVTDLAANADAQAVLDAIVRLAHALRMQVVAEGVETQAQADALTRLGCDLLQGFLFARPMPADEVPRWLAQHGGAPVKADSRVEVPA